jgi:hypothetical protein
LNQFIYLKELTKEGLKECGDTNVTSTFISCRK